MGIRETLNKNSKITVPVTLVLMLLAIGFLVWQNFGMGEPEPPREVYYTVDDGKTFFPAEATNVPPFDHEGQTAYRAYVYTCSETNETFVGYMERFKPETQDKLKTAYQAGTINQVPQETIAQGSEVKRPGDAQWVQRFSPEGLKVQRVECPNGSGTVQLLQ